MMVVKSDASKNTQYYNKREPAFGKIISFICILWSLFQIWIASDFPFYLSEILKLNLVFNSQEARQIHLAFGLGLGFLAYPVINKITPTIDKISKTLLAFLAVSACLYLYIFKLEISNRAGLPTNLDIFFSLTGLICIGIAVYRTLGLPLLIVASLFIFYVMFGHLEFIPESMKWKGASLNKASWHFWMQTEGVFGVALGVSTSMIFLFVLFGALLEKSGAGNYFIKLSFAALGHFRGGPAKAAVLASGLSGIYSGSSIANVVTTGTFTIPLMKRTGLNAEKAGAIEVASSTNGQLTPPVMGAAAFLISEFTDTIYLDLIKYAALPALASYAALFYIVHLEVIKLGLKGLNKQTSSKTLLRKFTGFILGFVSISILAGLVNFLFSWTSKFDPFITSITAITLFLIFYIFCVWTASKQPDLEIGLTDKEINNLPTVQSIATTGYYFLLPIVVLLWCVLISRLSPSLSAYWASLSIIFILLTQKPLKNFFRDQKFKFIIVRESFEDLLHGLIKGAQSMITISIATGIAGVIIGTVSLTGAHQFIGEFVEVLSSGNLVIMLLLVALMSLILGMGLPTTANYIVVSSLMAPVIVMVGAQNGLIVPLVAVHLFVFYFGILADDTPPVGLAAFAAAAISKGDPIKTGIQGFSYDIRTAILRFMFIFNTDILLINVSFFEGFVTTITVVLAMLAFCSAIQNYIIVKNKFYETLLLLLIAFSLFRPDFWLDKIQSPYKELSGNKIFKLIDGYTNTSNVSKDTPVRIKFSGPDFDDPERIIFQNSVIKLTNKGTVDEILKKAGLFLKSDDDNVLMEEPLPGSPLFQQMKTFDFYADTPVKLEMIYLSKTNRIPKEIFYLPALSILLLIYLNQVNRRRKLKRN
jgi:TRAP transporter 4TM/12TM fusion protein